MKEVAWQEITKTDRIVTKRRSFENEEAMEKFLNKLAEKENFLYIIAMR